MVKLALENYSFARISTWESETQAQWTRTRQVLDTHKRQMEEFLAGKSKPDWLPDAASPEEIRKARLYLICGEDLLESFNVPGLWSQDDVSL